jgi:hypothetical protein
MINEYDDKIDPLVFAGESARQEGIEKDFFWSGL